jgi:hypothetical protein
MNPEIVVCIRRVRPGAGVLVRDKYYYELTLTVFGKHFNRTFGITDNPHSNFCQGLHELIDMVGMQVDSASGYLPAPPDEDVAA